MDPIEESFKTVYRELAENLMRAVLTFIAKWQEFVGISNPAPHDTPSKDGEFLKKRTGFGQASITYEPSSMEAIAEALKVKVGLIENAFYMELMVAKYGRLGLDAALAQLESELSDILAGNA